MYKLGLKYVFLNYVVAYFPSWRVRRYVYRRFGMTIGDGARILMGTSVVAPENIVIGRNSTINEYCHLDGRGGLTICDNVSVSLRCILLTASHSKTSATFAYREGEVVLEDNVWIGAGAIVLDASRLKRGSILGAGSVLKGEAEEDTVYVGVPAQAVGRRGLLGAYDLSWKPHFR